MATSHLVLGWQVTPSGEPRFWLDRNLKLGSQRVTDLVRVPAPTVAAHTILIAQSGSGKSFFLGRMLEELMLQTKARAIVLDPNGDFRRSHEVEEATLWNGAAYDALKRIGRLPHEASRDEFEAVWSKIDIRIMTAKSDLAGIKPYSAIQLWWPSLSSEFLTEETNPRLRSELYHCHNFVRRIAQLSVYRYQDAGGRINVIDTAEKLYRCYRGDPSKADGSAEARLRDALEKEFDIIQMTAARATRLEREGRDKPRAVRQRSVLRNWFRQALAALDYVSASTARYYFAKAREYLTANIVGYEPPERTLKEPPRLEIVDLPSLRDLSTRLLVINSLVETEWERARNHWASALESDAAEDDRVPTFIVVDEAHNLIPREPRSKAQIALREQFRTIVAEGRKYGLFLILVSQRPDKLDPLVVTECENRAVMRLNSKAILEATRELLSLEDVSPKMLERCLEFGLGRVLLVGPWAGDGAQMMYCAARRTVEGGRNLRVDHWATPPMVPWRPLAEPRSPA